MFRQDQVEVAQRLFPAQWEALSATTTYKEGRAYLAKWSRSARTRYAHMHSSDRELLAIDILEEEWIKQYPGTKTLREEREKREEKQEKEFEAYVEAHKAEQEAYDKKWAKEYIEHWLDNMARWKREGIIKTLLDEEAYHDENFENALQKIKQFYGEEEEKKYRDQHAEIVEGVEYISHQQPKVEHKHDDLWKALMIEYLQTGFDIHARYELDMIILFSPESLVKECQAIYDAAMK